MSVQILLSDGNRVDPFAIAVMPAVHVFTRSLSMLNRYTGHTLRPYSVAEHTIRMATNTEVIMSGLQRAVLLHDFNEALTNDLPRPFKRVLPEYVALEEVVQRQIFAHFNEPWENMERLTEFDYRICEDEMTQLFYPPHSIGLVPLGTYIDPADQTGWYDHFLHLNYLCEMSGIK